MQELFNALDALLEGLDPSGEWPRLVELEAQTLVAQIEVRQGFKL